MVELNELLFELPPDRNHNRVVVLQIVPDENQSWYSLEQQTVPNLPKQCVCLTDTVTSNKHHLSLVRTIN